VRKEEATFGSFRSQRESLKARTNTLTVNRFVLHYEMHLYPVVNLAGLPTVIDPNATPSAGPSHPTQHNGTSKSMRKTTQKPAPGLRPSWHIIHHQGEFASTEIQSKCDPSPL
jgi:hypothetical protein